jgi:prevent-host-death family protein
MVQVVSAQQARKQFGEIMNMVYYQDKDVIVERAGKPMIRIIKLPSSFTLQKEQKMKKLADTMIGSLDKPKHPNWKTEKGTYQAVRNLRTEWDEEQ